MTETMTSAPAGLSDGVRGAFLPLQREEAWLAPELADELLEYAIASESRFVPAPVVYRGQKDVRPERYDALELDDPGSFGPFLCERLRKVLPDAQRSFGMACREAHIGRPKLTAYGDGAHFDTHIDTLILANSPFAKAGVRFLTAVLYLHERPRRFEGGELILHAVGGPGVMKLIPEHNSLTIFPAFAPHSVGRVSSPGDIFRNRRFTVNFAVYR